MTLHFNDTLRALPLLLAAALLPTGCGDEDPKDPPSEESVEAEACEHNEEGPFEDVTATADAGDGPDVSAPHRAFRITLPQGTSYVTYNATEDSEYVFFLGADVAFEIVDGEIEASEAGEECPDLVAIHHTADLQVGSHTLQFTTTQETEVTLVAEPASEHDDDGDHAD